MEPISISEVAARGMDYERNRVEVATFRIAIANASFASRSDLISFSEQLRQAMPSGDTTPTLSDADIRQVLDPTNPLADDNGYVYRFDVDPTHEMATLVSANRAYEANIRAYNIQSDMKRAALSIGSNR